MAAPLKKILHPCCYLCSEFHIVSVQFYHDVLSNSPTSLSISNGVTLLSTEAMKPKRLAPGFIRLVLTRYMPQIVAMRARTPMIGPMMMPMCASF